ncbi:hypothetical protein ACNKHT_17425 [Shigella flexneri]
MKRAKTWWVANPRESGENKIAAPFKQAEFRILYGEGINFYGELVHWA